MSDRIAVHGIRGFGFHGVYQRERDEGQEFIVDIELQVAKGSGANDELANTVDYGGVATAVHAAITGPPFALIEALAQHIADDVLAIPGVESVIVTVHKPHAPISVPFTDVTVTIERP